MFGEELRALMATPQGRLTALAAVAALAVTTIVVAFFFGFVGAGGLSRSPAPASQADRPASPAPAPAEAAPKNAPDTRPPEPEPTTAREAYQRSLEGFNTGDSEKHYAIYGESIDCFYNWTDYRLDALERMRAPQLQKGYRLEIEDTVVLENTDTLYDFVEDGVLHGPDDLQVSYRKRMIMKRSGGRWVVTTEVDDNAYNCFPEAF